MPTKRPTPKRRKVMLAMEWLDHEINRGITEYARHAGWIVDDVISHTGAPPATFTGDGIIALLRNKYSSLVKFVQSADVPVVDLVCELPEIKVPRVLADNQGIGRNAATHLLGCGVQHLAFFNLWNSHVENERMEGFRAAVQEAGRNFVAIEAFRRGNIPGGFDDIIAWLAEQITRLPKPLGIMGQHDREALYIVQACELAGVDVPNEVAVVGSDNDPLLCELGPVPLSSVDNRRRDQGYEAAKLLDRIMANPKDAPKQPIRVPAGAVIARQSTDILAIEDPDLSRALRYIAEHYHEEISVDDVVEYAGATRRRLYMLFDEHVGRPINAEILRRRLDHVRRLLVTTPDKLYAIARACGFRDAQHLTRVFAREVGIPPSQYRAQNPPHASRE